jgi:hypothetical protein
MRTIIIIAAFFGFSLSAFGQVLAIPTFTVGSNDVVQSSIMLFRVAGTNETRVSVKFAFTDAGAKRLADFYRAHTVGEDVRWQSGSFVHPFKLDDRKFFGREGFWGLPETDAKALEAGLRGQL